MFNKRRWHRIDKLYSVHISKRIDPMKVRQYVAGHDYARIAYTTKDGVLLMAWTLALSLIFLNPTAQIEPYITPIDKGNAADLVEVLNAYKTPVRYEHTYRAFGYALSKKSDKCAMALIDLLATEPQNDRKLINVFAATIAEGSDAVLDYIVKSALFRQTMKPRDETGRSLIHYLTYRPKGLAVAVKRTPFWELTDEFGRTPLHYAAMQSASAVEVLLNAGASPLIRDSQGKLAIDMTQKVRNETSRKLIQRILVAAVNRE